MGDVPRFIARRRRRQHAGGQPAIDGETFRRLGDKIRVPILLQKLADTIERIVPANSLPCIGPGRAILRVLEAALTVDKVNQSGAFRAQRAAVDRMIGIALDVEDARLRQSFELNFFAHQNVAQAAVKVMKDRGGSIVNMSSTTIDIARRKTLDYTIGKGCVAALTRVLATEAGPYGIRVNAIAPGFVATPGFTAKLQTEAQRDAHFQGWYDMSPMGRISSAQEIGYQVLYLASEASSFVTGQILRANGGATMPW